MERLGWVQLVEVEASRQMVATPDCNLAALRQCALRSLGGQGEKDAEAVLSLLEQGDSSRLRVYLEVMDEPALAGVLKRLEEKLRS